MISFLIISDDDLPRIICSNEWPLYNQHVRPGPHSKFKILIKNRPVRENHILSKFWFRQKLLFFDSKMIILIWCYGSELSSLTFVFVA